LTDINDSEVGVKINEMIREDEGGKQAFISTNAGDVEVERGVTRRPVVIGGGSNSSNVDDFSKDGVIIKGSSLIVRTCDCVCYLALVS
jgi:hypothetical protein